MVAFQVLAGIIIALAGAMTGKYFLILIALLIFIIPPILGGFLVGMDWWIWLIIILIGIIMLTRGKKK